MNLLVIILALFSPLQEEKLFRVLREQRPTIAWTIANIKGINPSYCKHKILLEDNHKPSVEDQHYPNSIMKNMVKKEIIKWLDGNPNIVCSQEGWHDSCG